MFSEAWKAAGWGRLWHCPAPNVSPGADLRLEGGKWGHSASPRKPAVVLGSIKEKSALFRAWDTPHRGTRYWQGDGRQLT